MKKVIGTFIILTTISLNIMAQQKIVQTAGRHPNGGVCHRCAGDAHLAQSIHIPANVKHWHGAAGKTAGLPTSPLKFLVRNTSNEWLEAVSDEGI